MDAAHNGQEGATLGAASSGVNALPTQARDAHEIRVAPACSSCDTTGPMAIAGTVQFDAAAAAELPAPVAVDVSALADSALDGAQSRVGRATPICESASSRTESESELYIPSEGDGRPAPAAQLAPPFDGGRAPGAAVQGEDLPSTGQLMHHDLPASPKPTLPTDTRTSASDADAQAAVPAGDSWPGGQQQVTSTTAANLNAIKHVFDDLINTARQGTHGVVADAQLGVQRAMVRDDAATTGTAPAPKPIPRDELASPVDASVAPAIDNGSATSPKVTDGPSYTTSVDGASRAPGEPHKRVRRSRQSPSTGVTVSYEDSAARHQRQPTGPDTRPPAESAQPEGPATDTHASQMPSDPDLWSQHTSQMQAHAMAQQEMVRDGEKSSNRRSSLARRPRRNAQQAAALQAQDQAPQRSSYPAGMPQAFAHAGHPMVLPMAADQGGFYGAMNPMMPLPMTQGGPNVLYNSAMQPTIGGMTPMPMMVSTPGGACYYYPYYATPGLSSVSASPSAYPDPYLYGAPYLQTPLAAFSQSASIQPGPPMNFGAVTMPSDGTGGAEGMPRVMPHSGFFMSPVMMTPNGQSVSLPYPQRPNIPVPYGASSVPQPATQQHLDAARSEPNEPAPPTATPSGAASSATAARDALAAEEHWQMVCRERAPCPYLRAFCSSPLPARACASIVHAMCIRQTTYAVDSRRSVRILRIRNVYQHWHAVHRSFPGPAD